MKGNFHLATLTTGRLQSEKVFEPRFSNYLFLGSGGEYRGVTVPIVSCMHSRYTFVPNNLDDNSRSLLMTGSKLTEVNVGKLVLPPDLKQLVLDGK